VKRRPTLRNKSMSRQIKIELVASALEGNGASVEILSSGEVVDPHFRFYPALSESERFHPHIPIYYSSALAVPWLNGAWSNRQMLRLFKARHHVSPYDLVIIWNMKGAHIKCANYAMQRCRLPVILAYEDDAFVSRAGEPVRDGLFSCYRAELCRNLLKAVSGAIGVSPYLLSQLPDDIPKMLLRGTVGDDLASAGRKSRESKKNWILFAGTHEPSNGVAELIEAWRVMKIPDWELHITGHGEMTEELRNRARDVEGIRFHGLVSRQTLVDLLSTAKICVNPHIVSRTPGNLFAFKIIEYLAAGANVVTTPMGQLERELEAGITYLPDNSPETIAETLQHVIRNHRYERTAMEAAQEIYGTAAVAESLNALVSQVMGAQGSCRAKQMRPVEYTENRLSS
jgi:glycosyltransferase involved in cell wall biosynthesis